MWVWPKIWRRMLSSLHSNNGPTSGVPEKPGAWLMATAKHRALDHFRRSALLDRKHAELGREVASKEMDPPDFDSAADNDLEDDLLRLIFISCHPALSTDAQAALTLRLLGGLTTDEIARAFLVPEPTIAQRIVRAKRTLARQARSLRSSRRRRADCPFVIGTRRNLPHLQ